MYRSVFALLSGAIFGLGLIVAGMANPAKVLAFLDVTGHWDPSLALVMVGAIAVAAPAFFWVRRRPRTLLGETVQLPSSAASTAAYWQAARCLASGGEWRASVPARPGCWPERARQPAGSSLRQCWQEWRCMKLFCFGENNVDS